MIKVEIDVVEQRRPKRRTEEKKNSFDRPNRFVASLLFRDDLDDDRDGVKFLNSEKRRIAENVVNLRTEKLLRSEKRIDRSTNHAEKRHLGARKRRWQTSLDLRIIQMSAEKSFRTELRVDRRVSPVFVRVQLSKQFLQTVSRGFAEQRADVHVLQNEKFETSRSIGEKHERAEACVE